MRATLPLLLLAVGCSRPDPAPDDLDGVLHFLWSGWEEGSDASLEGGIANLDAALLSLEEQGEGLPYKGTQTDLTREEIDTLTFTGGVPDPSLANGFFVGTEMACSAAEIDELFAALDQDELHPGTYDFYERVYTSDPEPYFAREVDRLTWDVEIHASPVGFDYIEFIQGGSRFLEWDGGGVVLGRTHLIEPATEDDDNKSFDQDYQLDVYYERAPGELVHLWVIWRQIDLGSYGDQDSTALIAITLGEGEDWDEDTEALCEDLRE